MSVMRWGITATVVSAELYSISGMVEQDLVMMRRQIAALQKELEKKEQELKIKHRSEDHVESRNEEDKGDCAHGPI